MRPSFDEIFMRMALLMSERSTCLSRKTGAVLVKDNKVLATGYNGAPSKTKHCTELGFCKRRQSGYKSGEYKDELCRAVHAEENCLLQAAKFGISSQDSILYSTNFPCTMCSKSIINAGVKEVIYFKDYPNELSKNLLKEAGVKVRQISPNIEHQKKL